MTWGKNLEYTLIPYAELGTVGGAVWGGCWGRGKERGLYIYTNTIVS